MLRERVVVDLDSLGILDTVQRCMQVARVMNATVSSDAQLRARFVKEGLIDRLKAEAIQRKAAQATATT
jgi:hypothetical protein